MRVRLNLATKPLLTHRRFIVGSGLLAIVAGVTFLVLGWHVYTVRKADSEFRTQAEDTRQKLAASAAERIELERFFDRPENKQLHERSAFLNSIIDARSFNWTLMFMDLEKVLPGGVRLLSIEPQQVKGRVTVKIKVGTSSEEAKLKFIRALEESKEFSDVQLVSDHAALSGDPADKETLELNVVYSRT
jgi:type IV pilus assembly protein PilN